jgi:hypothetical protein
MKTTVKRHYRLTLLALISAFAMPSVGTAKPPEETQPIAATGDDDDPPCESAVVALEVDVATGDVYIVNATGGLTLTDNDISVYYGSLPSIILVDIEYSSGEWELEVTPNGDPSETYYTRGGSVRYWMNTDHTSYVFSSTYLSAMNMTPVVPDIIIRPKPDCPPSP